MVLFSMTESGYAQERLTLKQAIQYALEHKADAQKSRLDVENAENQIKESKANVLPHINGSGYMTYNPKLQQMALDFNGQTQILRIGTPWQSNATIQVDQQIFNQAAFTGLKAAKTTREFYLLNADLTEEQIIEKVAENYFMVFKTLSQIETLDKTIANNNQLKTVMENLESDGLAKGIDVDRIRVAVNNLTSAKVQLQNFLKIQENGLKYLIGMDINTDIVFPDDEFEITSFSTDRIGYDLDNRTEIRMLKKQGELLELNKMVIKSSLYPTLGLSANYGYLSMGDRFPYFAGKDKGVTGSDFAGITLNLTVPIFDGYAVRSKMRQADIEIKKHALDILDTKLALDLQIENANTQMENAIITIGDQKANMELAAKVLKNIENNYKNGLATLTDLIDAENSYVDAQNNYSTAIVDYRIAEIQLKKSTGVLKSYYLN